MIIQLGHKIEEDRIRIPKLGWVRLKESFCCFGKIMNATVSRTADKWFVSIGVKIARLHYRISCIRHDALHKLTSMLVRKFSVVVLEDLNVSGLLKNGKLAKAISDMGFYEFRRQLDYKGQISGTHVIVADRWFPSSKRCSECGEVHRELTLSDRTFVCPMCGFYLDRDENAAGNLEKYLDLMAA